MRQDGYRDERGRVAELQGRPQADAYRLETAAWDAWDGARLAARAGVSREQRDVDAGKSADQAQDVRGPGAAALPQKQRAAPGVAALCTPAEVRSAEQSFVDVAQWAATVPAALPELPVLLRWGLVAVPPAGVAPAPREPEKPLAASEQQVAESAALLEAGP